MAIVGEENLQREREVRGRRACTVRDGEGKTGAWATGDARACFMGKCEERGAERLTRAGRLFRRDFARVFIWALCPSLQLRLDSLVTCDPYPYIHLLWSSHSLTRS